MIMDSNRVETELSKWLEVEARIGKLFSNSPTSNKAMLRQKLRQYGLLAYKYRSNANANERYTLDIIAQESRTIERQLYPNLLARLLRRLVVSPILSRRIGQAEIKDGEMNIKTLQDDLRRMGFSDIFDSIREKISEGHGRFSVPVSHFIDNKIRMDYKISITADGNGQHKIKGFEAILHDRRKPADIKGRFFEQSQSNGLNAVQSYHLLSGRSLEMNGKWCQLDFNDRDAHGNYLLKDYRTGLEYDLHEKLKMLAIKDTGFDNRQKLVDGLKEGERKEATLVLNGKEVKIFIEANPQFRTLTIYDEHSKKITMNKPIEPNDLSAVRSLLNGIGEKPNNRKASKKNN
jgi:hypothetical protein